MQSDQIATVRWSGEEGMKGTKEEPHPRITGLMTKQALTAFEAYSRPLEGLV